MTNPPLDDATLDEWLAQASKRGKTEVLYADGTTHSERIERLISALRESRGEIEKLNKAIFVWKSDCLDNGKIVDEQVEEIILLRDSLEYVAENIRKQEFAWKEASLDEIKEALAWRPEGK